MAITINCTTKEIQIPKADLTFITGNLYELDVGALKTELGSLMDDEDHIYCDDPFRHNTEVTVAGTTFARTVEIINGYNVTFEDGAYSVRLTGANNNVFDAESGILNRNQVQIIAQNSAGLINTGKPLSAQEVRDSMELEATSGADSIDTKLDNNIAVSAAGMMGL